MNKTKVSNIGVIIMNGSDLMRFACEVQIFFLICIFFYLVTDVR